ncbi:MAG: hypothetical protein BWY21_00041 [Parcubacteria group bacterium ADurb.Bin216]|nr:MAG: hypothetical protein BWY21_00041 [Parcubacteria group bacterium ADurb.Bin216]
MNNRLWNARNPAQGEALKALCICSAGLLRSPTLAWILSNEPFSFNTRAAGSTKTFALIHADEVLLHWADIIVFANEENYLETMGDFPEIEQSDKQIITLDIPDRFQTRDPRLVDIAFKQLKPFFDLT